MARANGTCFKERIPSAVVGCATGRSLVQPTFIVSCKIFRLVINHTFCRELTLESIAVFIARTFWFEPVKRGRVAGVSATPNARPIAFQQVVPEYLRTFIRLSQVKKLLALLLALGDCEVVTFSKLSLEMKTRVRNLPGVCAASRKIVPLDPLPRFLKLAP
jgi:hypothetical protein